MKFNDYMQWHKCIDWNNLFIVLTLLEKQIVHRNLVQVNKWLMYKIISQIISNGRLETNRK